MSPRKVAIVTGAASGIGVATARRLCASGFAVGLVDRDVPGAQAGAAAATEAGGMAIAVEADVAREDDVAAAVRRVTRQIGAPTVLVSSAGRAGAGPVTQLTLDSWERTIAVNLTSVFLFARELSPCFREQGGGSIVTVASTAALAGVDGMAAYCASKGGVVALTRALAVELGPLGVRVNAVCPGTVETPFSAAGIAARGGGDLERGRRATAAHYPVGRIGTPDEIAALIAFLAGEDAGFITGSTIIADGGLLSRLPVPVPVDKLG